MKTTATAALALALLGVGPGVHGQATTQPPAADKPAPIYEPVRERDARGRVLAPESATSGPAGADWWDSAVFYQVFVRSFQDSGSGPLANDGIGDLRGLIERLDYLNDGDPKTTTDLGVDALWLMPIHPSPSYHGYDIEDYRAVNPQYGTLDDFRLLMQECRKRGIKVILDLVINHAASTHPWFVEAQDPKSPKRDWFIWSDTDPGYRGPWGQQVWQPQRETPRRRRGPGTGGDGNVRAEPDASPQGPFFYGLFSRQMPDLNFRNPEVSNEILDITRFWLSPQVGADGFRLDAIRHLIEDGKFQDNTPETHAWLEKFYATYKGVNPSAVAVGEVWASTEIASSYVGNQMDLAFEFDLAGAMVKSVQTGVADFVIDAQEKVLKFYPPGQYGRFLTNHDQTRVASELAEPGALAADPGKLRVAASLLLTGPGVPFIYYAEELGQPGVKPDPQLRTPMPWVEPQRAGAAANESPEANPASPRGFSMSKPWKAPFAAPAGTSVQTQTGRDDSLLSHYRRLIALRRAHPALAVGDIEVLKADHHAVYAFLRHAPGVPGSGDAAKAHAIPVLVVVNVGDREVVGAKVSSEHFPLAGTYAGQDVLREGQAPAASVRLTARGGKLSGTELPTLGAFQTIIVPLKAE